MDDESTQKMTRAERNFAAEVERLRKEHGWSQSELAIEMNERGLSYMNQMTVSRIEKTQRPVRMIEAQALTMIFNRSLDAMTDPDGSNLVLTLVERNHKSHRKAYVAFKTSTEQFAASQWVARGDIDWLERQFPDGSELDPETKSRVNGLLGNLRQLSQIPLVSEAQEISEQVRKARSGKHPETS